MRGIPFLQNSVFLPVPSKKTLYAASVTDWSGDSKIWYCLTDWCVNGSQTLNAFPLWVFILAQFIAAVALFVSAYRDHKKQA